VALDHAAGWHGEIHDDRIEIGVKKLDDRGAGGDADEPVGAEVVGKRDVIAAAQRDAGLVEILTSDDILHAPRDGAGGGGNGGRRCKHDDRSNRHQPKERGNQGDGDFRTSRQRARIDQRNCPPPAEARKHVVEFHLPANR